MINSLGVKITELRKKKSLTQQDLADMLYVSNKTVSRWERGYGEPDIDQLIRLSDIFEISIDFLIGATTEDGRSNEMKAAAEKAAKEAYEKTLHKYKVIKNGIIWAFGISACVAAVALIFIPLLITHIRVEKSYVLTDKFEAEYALLSGDNPKLDGTVGFVEEATMASNGKCIAYFGAKGNTATFKIVASEADEQAVLTVAVNSMWNTVTQQHEETVFDEVWNVEINGETVKTNVTYISLDHTNAWYDFVDVRVTISIKKGENVIKLICPETGDGIYGLNVDYLQISAVPQLKWIPYKDNITRPMDTSL